MKFLRSRTGYSKMGQIKNTKTMEEMNIYNVNNEILKWGTHWKYHIPWMDNRWIAKKILTYNPKERNLGCLQLRSRNKLCLQEDRRDKAWPNPWWWWWWWWWWSWWCRNETYVSHYRIQLAVVFIVGYHCYQHIQNCIHCPVLKVKSIHRWHYWVSSVWVLM
jgi:hypothetical protein